MTARVQHLRLASTNQVPNTLARPPGELWVNYADLRLGVINAAKAPQDLLAVRRHAATASYAIGDFVFQAGQLYRSINALAPKVFTAIDWDPVITQVSGDARYLRLAGGNIPGNVNIQGTLTVAGATTLQGVTAQGITCLSLASTGDIATAAGTLRGANLTISNNAQVNGTLNAGALTGSSGNISGPLQVQSLVVSPGQVVANVGQFSSLTVLNNAQVNGTLNAGTLTGNSGMILGSWQVRSLTVTPGAIAANNASFVDVVASNLTASGTVGAGAIVGFASVTAPNMDATNTVSATTLLSRNQVYFGYDFNTSLRLYADSANSIWQVHSSNARWAYNRLSGNMAFFGTSGAPLLQISDSTFISAHAASFKPGGGPWVDSSDKRIKTVHGLYTRGLKDLLRLNPVRYSFRNNCAIGGYAIHQFEAGKERAGFVAQEVETSWPELVSRTEGQIDDVWTKDIRVLDTNAISYAMINALREIDARLRVFEWRPAEDGPTTTTANTPANPPDEGDPA
jgi:cytoskeletal protein CcmA (bactofilin family)